MSHLSSTQMTVNSNGFRELCARSVRQRPNIWFFPMIPCRHTYLDHLGKGTLKMRKATYPRLLTSYGSFLWIPKSYSKILLNTVWCSFWDILPPLVSTHSGTERDTGEWHSGALGNAYVCFSLVLGEEFQWCPPWLRGPNPGSLG
jgi:hypothetical protein